MKEYEKDGILYAITGSLNKDVQNKSEWFGNADQGVQVAGMFYGEGKQFACHRHKERSRTFNRTQECLFCYKGIVAVELYDNKKSIMDTVVLTSGEFIICYNGYHFVKILKDNTKLLEVKNGPYTTVEEDKEYYV